MPEIALFHLHVLTLVCLDYQEEQQQHAYVYRCACGAQMRVEVSAALCTLLAPDLLWE